METLSRYHLRQRLSLSSGVERYFAYEVTSGGLVRPVLLTRAHAQDAAAVQRVLDEGQVLAMLSHPHLVRLVDIGHEDEAHYVVTEWLEGRDLATLLSRATARGITFDPKPALYLCMKVSEALAHLHDRTDGEGRALGIVHAGLRPEAIQLGYQGEVVLADLSQARTQNSPRSSVPTDEALLRYSSPEHALGTTIDHRADVYALGLILYELLAGRPAYPDQIRARAERADFRPLGDTAGHIAPELVQIVHRALSFDKAQRFRSAHEIRDALATQLHNEDPTFAAHRFANFVSMLLADEAEQDRQRDQESRALLTTGGNSALGERYLGRTPAGNDAHTLAQETESDEPDVSLEMIRPRSPTPEPTPIPSEPPRKSSLAGKARAPTAAFGGDNPLLEAAPPKATPAQSTEVPAPLPLPAAGPPVAKIAATLLAVLVASLLAFTFSSQTNERLVRRKLRQGLLGRKAGAVLKLESNPPGAQLFLDDQDTGQTTPVTIENVESEIVHSVRLELSGEKAVTATIALVAGVNKTLSMVFPDAVVNLSLQVVPEASEFWMDGRKIALTPTSITIRVGQPAKLEVKRLGYVTWTEEISPKRGETIDLNVILEKTPELLEAEAAEAEAIKAAEAEEQAAKPTKRRKPRRKRR